jgi:DNA polymerase-3 subunit delta
MAGRQAGGQVLESVRRRLKQGWPPGLTVLTGGDLFHLDTAQRVILATLVPEPQSGYGLSIFGPDRVDVGTVVAAARSAGMFDPRRVVLVRDGAALEGDPGALEEFASKPPPESYLLVRAPALDRRRKLHKILAGSGQLLTFAPATQIGRMVADVKTLAAAMGLKLDRAATEFLALSSGGDLYRTAAELEKIRAWLGEDGARKVDLRIVREVAVAGGLLSGWEMADGVTARDRGRALAAARRVVDAGEEPLRILGGLAWRARVMLEGKALLERGGRPAEVVKRVRAWSFEDDLLQGLSRYSIAELLAFPAGLLEADRALKSRAIDPRAVLESLVDRLIGGTETGRGAR